jgi:hypothetical protein
MTAASYRRDRVEPTEELAVRVDEAIRAAYGRRAPRVGAVRDEEDLDHRVERVVGSEPRDDACRNGGRACGEERDPARPTLRGPRGEHEREHDERE